MNTQQTLSVGQLLRTWRQRRRLSQLELALEAAISPKHLSFVETGRATPSRDMVLHLAEQLAVPLREQNILLTAAGYAPIFPEQPLDTPAFAMARQAIELVLRGHEPYPALAVDRHWTLIAANRAVPLLTTGVDPALLKPPVNVIRLSLHPAGLAPRIINYWPWRAHFLARLRHQVELSADPVLADLVHEVACYAAPTAAGSATPPTAATAGAVAVPLQLRMAQAELAFISTTTIFGTPIDITLAELAIESFFPANAATATMMQHMLAQHEQG
ncbi:helix-turn-helix transcriptional regulator [Candidatus Gracilibacteria bacterium]|nr:helix-turn-helix transcriptional regulator [Candidatus Gracilibacteria bacterium]